MNSSNATRSTSKTSTSKPICRTGFSLSVFTGRLGIVPPCPCRASARWHESGPPGLESNRCAPALGERQKSPHSGRRGPRSGSVRRLPQSLPLSGSPRREPRGCPGSAPPGAFPSAYASGFPGRKVWAPCVPGAEAGAHLSRRHGATPSRIRACLTIAQSRHARRWKALGETPATRLKARENCEASVKPRRAAACCTWRPSCVSMSAARVIRWRRSSW